MASDAVVDQINIAIRDGQVTNRAGQQLETVIDGGLVRADSKCLYPIIQGIPLLLADDAIDLQQVALT